MTAMRQVSEPLHFRNVVYHQPNINYSIKKDKLAWPTEVRILTDRALDRTSPFEFLYSSFPSRNSYGAAALEFQSAKIPLELSAQALRLWWALHDRLITYLISINEYKEHNQSPSFVYNLTWARLRYINGQSPQVLRMSHRIQFDPSYAYCSLLQHGNNIS